jgi:anti-sigma regulatory factor (Ser/Thr protein kinase)
MMPATFDRLRLPACIASVRPFCEFARAKAVSAGFTSEELDRLDLVIEELVVNIARYAYDQPATGEVELACAVTGLRTLSLVISDQGRAFDPLASEPPDLSRGLADRPVGGLGIFLVRSIAESIAYERDGNQNVLRFQFSSA